VQQGNVSVDALQIPRHRLDPPLSQPSALTSSSTFPLECPVM
jgi:hypothetical protein